MNDATERRFSQRLQNAFIVHPLIVEYLAAMTGSEYGGSKVEIRQFDIRSEESHGSECRQKIIEGCSC